MTINMVSTIFNIISSVITSLPVLLLLRSDIIIISVPTGEAAFGTYMIAKLLKKKIIFDYRDEWEDHFISVSASKVYKKFYENFKNYMSKSYSSSKMVCTVTLPLYEKLRKRNVLNVVLVPNGADCKVFKPYPMTEVRNQLGLDERDFVLVYSGGIGGYYRVDLLIKALSILSKKNQKIKLILLGNGPDTTKVMTLAKDLKVDDRVFLIGPITDKKYLSRIISCSNLGIIPYDSNPLWKNSLPAKLFEYGACGIPVVATVYPDSILAKLINENQIGITCSPDNLEALIDTIEKTMQMDLISCGSKAVELIKGSYDRSMIAHRFLTNIKKLM